MSLVNAETGEVIVPLDRDEAERLTQRIREAAEQTWRLLEEAHDRRAWAALDYETWADYVGTEFGMGRAHAYRLLDQGRVIRAIEEASGVSPMGDISEREARDLKSHLNLVTERIREQTADAPPEEIKERVREIVTEVRREVERERQEREEQREWVKANTPPDFDAKADAELVRQRGLLLRLPRELASVGDPVETVARQATWLRDEHINAAEAAYCWLDAFLNEWRNQ